VARYEVFDLLGRVVRVVETLSFAVGWHQIVWDGRDEKGELVPAGTYFVRVLVSPNDHSDRVLWQAIRKIVRVSHGKN
jgi:flagellar hook assembly protein FlgD